MNIKLGLKPFVPKPRDLKFADYLTGVELPIPPIPFGHAKLFGRDQWLMLGNDQFGDCAFAGPAHQTMAWNKVVGTDVPMNDECVLQCYGECTGFDPSTGNGDNGTDMHDLADYWVNNGILDANGVRHKIEGYVFLEPGNIMQRDQAMYLFESLGIGFRVPQSAIDQFHAGEIWDVVPDDGGIVGGHYVPGVGEGVNTKVVTWATLQEMSDAFYMKYTDQILVPITKENLVNGKSPEGFAYAQLQADIKALRQA